MKPIRLSGHAREQLYFRGTTEEEILESITTVSWQDAELGRLECKKNFVFEKECVLKNMPHVLYRVTKERWQGLQRQ